MEKNCLPERNPLAERENETNADAVEPEAYSDNSDSGRYFYCVLAMNSNYAMTTWYACAQHYPMDDIIECRDDEPCFVCKLESAEKDVQIAKDDFWAAERRSKRLRSELQRVEHERDLFKTELIEHQDVDDENQRLLSRLKSVWAVLVDYEKRIVSPEYALDRIRDSLCRESDG